MKWDKSEKKRGGSSKWFRCCMMPLGIAFLALALAILVGYRYLSSPLDPGNHKFKAIAIPKGASAHTIAAILTADGIVKSVRVFQVEAVLMDARSKLHPGTYQLSPGMTAAEVIAILVSGKTAYQEIVIPPGFTIRQIAQRLDADHLAPKAEFLNLALKSGRSFHGAKGFVPPDESLEGYLYPDSYRISPGTPTRMIIADMLDNFERKVVAQHPNVKAWHDPMIVASMVEREAKLPSDQPKIAAVIYNRLRIHMNLGIDATIEYVLPEHKTRLMFSDVHMRSPYNTYDRAGLTPTPICSPGAGAIEAALHPASSDYLYYFAGPDGRHIFTKSLAEHDAVIHRIRTGLQSD